MGQGERDPGSDSSLPHAFVHPGGEPSSCPASTEAEEKACLQPSSALGPGGCSWDFWLLQHCLPLAGNALVLPPAPAFCSAFAAAGWSFGVLPALRSQHATAKVGLGLTGVQPGQGSYAASSSSSSLSPHCWLPLAVMMSPVPLSVLHCTCRTLPGRRRYITACQSCRCEEHGGGKLISPDDSNPTRSSPVSFLQQ